MSHSITDQEITELRGTLLLERKQLSEVIQQKDKLEADLYELRLALAQFKLYLVQCCIQEGKSTVLDQISRGYWDKFGKDIKAILDPWGTDAAETD